MTTISNAIWDDVVAAASAGIERLNTHAVERGTRYHFELQKYDCGDVDVLLTAQHDNGRLEKSHAVARVKESGELKKAKRVRRGGQFGVEIKPAPKKWQSLSAMPADSIVKELGLLSFMMVLSASYAGSTTIRMDSRTRKGRAPNARPNLQGQDDG